MRLVSVKMWTFLVVFTLFNSAHGLFYPRIPTLKTKGIKNETVVFITTCMAKNSVGVCQKKAAVNPLKSNVKSYSGFFTVDIKYNSSMFFWYFPSESKKTAPLILWLQGGPGASSLYGVFEENGPFYIRKERGLKMRKHYWSQYFHMLYIDNPVGTGFSFTNDTRGYSRNQDDVAKNLYESLRQFFKLFPDLQSNEFFVMGESYAGKYVSAIARMIDMKNPSESDFKINLKGIAIGNGLVDPVNMMNYGDYLYQIGLVDINGRSKIKNQEKYIVQQIQKNKFLDALNAFDGLLNGELTPYKSLFYNLTNFDSYFNYIKAGEESPYGTLESYLNKTVFRTSAHVGELPFNEGKEVEKYLLNDIMQSVRPWLEELIEKYRVLIYNGQLDLIVAYPLTENYLQKLKWSGSVEYLTTKRKPWQVDGKIAGFYKQVRGFREALVRNAGHMVPKDQPYWALELIRKFVLNKTM